MSCEGVKNVNVPDHSPTCQEETRPQLHSGLARGSFAFGERRDEDCLNHYASEGISGIWKIKAEHRPANCPRHYCQGASGDVNEKFLDRHEKRFI